MELSPKSDTQFNRCGIIEFYDVPNTVMLKLSGYKQTQSPSEKGIR